MSAQLLSLKSKSKKKVVVKVGMVGDSQIGKTSLMVKYVEGHFNEDYIQTLGTRSHSHTHTHTHTHAHTDCSCRLV